MTRGTSHCLSPQQRARLERLQVHVDEMIEDHRRQRAAAALATESRARNTWRGRARRAAVLALGAAAVLLMAPKACERDLSGATATAAAGASTPSPSPAPKTPREAAESRTAHLRHQADDEALAADVHPRLYAALIKTESDWREDARGAAGEIGLAQLKPSTARLLGVDPRDVRQNLRGGARLLRAHYDRTGDWTRALEAYNGRGPRARAYAQRVLRAWEASE